MNQNLTGRRVFFKTLKIMIFRKRSYLPNYITRKSLKDFMLNGKIKISQSHRIMMTIFLVITIIMIVVITILIFISITII